MNEFWKILETELYIIVRITHKSATLATRLFQQGQTFVDKRFASALLMNCSV